MPVAVSTRYSDGTMPLAVVHASRVTNSATNPFNYYVDKPAYDGKKPSLSRTVTAKSPQTPSGYMPGFQQIVGIKSGILLPGNPREFFAFATTWPSSYAREVFRIDLFSLSSDVKDFKHEKSITLDTATTNGGYFMRIAAGNFMGSGKKEIAVLSNHIDTWKFHLNVYSLEMVNNGKELYITHIVKDMEVYKNDAKVDYKERDMWFRKAMGDIVMADFDGDGRDEIAVIYKGYAEDWSNYSNTSKTISNNMKKNFGTFWGSIHVDMFKYDATGKTARKTNSATRNYSEASDDTSGPDSAILNQYTLKSVGDLKAVAADIDGDGKYELAMLVVLWDARFLWYSVAQNYMMWGNWSSRLDIWSFSNDSKSLLKPSFLKTAADFGKFYESTAQTAVSDMTAQSNRSALAYGTFAEQAFSLVAGSFTGMYNTQTGRLCDDIAVSRASLEGINHRYPECWVKILQPAYDAKGILSSFKVTTPYSFNDSGNTKKYTTIGLAAGDFFKSGIILKEPVHWVVTGQQVPVALVPTPPYHVDYIPLPWSTDKNPKLANISYIPDTTLTYKRSTSSQNKKDISSAVTSGWESKTDGAVAWSWGIPLMPADDAKYNPKFSVQATGNFKYLDKTTKNLTASTVDTKTMNLKITSGKYDSSLIYGITQHLWCYPIDPVPDWYKPANGAKMGKDGKLAMTVTMTEDPQERSGTSYGYRARHEEGNLFSYPANIEKIPDFRKLNTQLHSGQQVHDFDSTVLETSMKFENSITSGDSVTSDITKEGGFTFGVMFGKADLGSTGIRASEAMQWSGQSVNKTALTRTTTKTDEIAVKFSNPTTPPSSLKQPLAGRIEDVSYRTTLQAYTNPQGVLTVGYAVDLHPDGKAAPVLWRDSVYTISADPSFVLPKKFSFRNGAFEPNTDILTAADMRGTLFYDGSDTKKETILENETLEAGKSYIISVPVYNASFVAANNILVRLSYKKYESRAKTLTGGTKIGDTTFNLGGWDKSDSNKGYADFKWTVPTNITAGQYMLIVEIDPNNTIAEIHEAWNAKIPGGNNIGYTLITIPNAGNTKAPKNFTAKGAVEVKDDYNYYDANAIYDYAKKDSGDTEITLMATAEGDFSYTNALFEVVQYSTEYDDDGTSYDVATVLDSNYYALIPGDHIYDTTFILTEEDLISVDKIFLEITTEDNFFSIPLSGGTYNASSPDENNNDNNGGGNNNNNNQNNTDNQNNNNGGNNNNQNNNNTDNRNNGGNSSDNTPNNDNNTTPKFVSRAFSKRYTLTRSQPVLWRIGTLTASISGSFLAAENADGLLAVEIEPTTAGTIPTDKITITATTKSGVTKEGVYSIPVEVSEDGETWYNADNLKFDTSDTTSDSESTTARTLGSSGGGCAGISASGLAIVILAGMMIRRKTR